MVGRCDDFIKVEEGNIACVVIVGFIWDFSTNDVVDDKEVVILVEKCIGFTGDDPNLVGVDAIEGVANIIVVLMEVRFVCG